MSKPSNYKAPSNIKSLLRGDPAGLDEGKFYRGFGTTPYAYFEGFDEFFDACLLIGGFGEDRDLAYQAIKQSTAEAVEMAPKEWRAQFPNGKWGVCDPEQVDRARNYNLMRLDKALLVLSALAVACTREAFPVLNTLNPFEYITIHPAIYKVTGLEKWAVLTSELPGRMTDNERQLVALLHRKLQSAAPRKKEEATDLRATETIEMAFEGRGMTWKNAELVRSTIHDAVFGKDKPSKNVPGEDCLLGPLEVAVLDGRNDGGKFTSSKYANRSEGPFVTLSKERSLELRAAVKKRQEALMRPGGKTR